MTEKKPTFEATFDRLEKILDTLNTNQVSLEDSLKLFEEANSLISCCDQFLVHSEKKIETLIKSRDGKLQLDETETPVTAPFSCEKEHIIEQTAR